MGVIENIMKKIGLDDEEEFVEEVQTVKTVKEEPKLEPQIQAAINRNPKVVSIHQNQQFKMVVVQPTNLEDAKEICDYLKDRKPVVVNIDIEGLNNDMPQRIIDFLSGCVYALDGTIEIVTKGIYIVAPSNVDVNNNQSYKR